MALHLPIGSLKTHSGLELLPRYEPSTYQLATAPSGQVPHGGPIKLFLVPDSSQ